VPRPLPRSSRRSLLHGVVATAGLGGLATTSALGLSGCSADDPAPAPGTPVTSSTAGTNGPDGPDEAADAGDADTALVAQVVEELSQARARVLAQRRAHPPLADRLRPLERLHARHAAELGGLVDVPAVRAERRRGRVLARVADTEARLQERLVAHAVAADSGALALLVASMAAGVAQERARL
jgi:hypothetical protein